MLKGTQTPTFVHAPDGDESDALDAIEVAAAYGLVADEWQEHVLRTWMRRDAQGRWAAGRWGIAVPRQNGKNAVVEILELYALTILGLRILHTAHEVKTARKAFLRLASFFENEREYPDLAGMVKSIRKANGQEAIFLTNGASVEFIARSKNSGRGFTVDMLVCDEAQEYPEEAQAALLPTISAAPSGDPVQVILGTPPGPKDNGDVFARMHAVAHERIDPRLSWAEWAATGEVDTSDRQGWATTNPSVGGRLLESTIEDEFASFSREMFARERLGMWSSDRELSVIPQKDWDDCLVGSAPDGEITAIGLDMNPERTSVVVAVALKTEAGTHVELARVDEPDSTIELVNWVSQRAKRRVPVVMDSYSPARSLEPGLKQKKARTFALSGNELMQACGGFYDAVTQDRTVSHIGQEQLDASLAGAKRQSIGDAGGWKWSRKNLDSDLVPLMAVTCAWFGAEKFAKPPRSSIQKGRVLLG